MKERFISAALAAVLCGAVCAAHAAPTLSLSFDGGAAITCADGNPLCDVNGEAGVVQISQSLGAFVVNATTGISKPLLSGGSPLMDLASLNVQVLGGAHTLVIKFSDTDFDLYGGRLKMVYGGTLIGAGGSFSHAAYYDAGNALWGQGELIGQVAYGASLEGFGGSIDGGWSPDGLYSVTEVLTINTAGKTTFSGDFAVNVPEPTTLALLGLVLLGFAAAYRRRVPA